MRSFPLFVELEAKRDTVNAKFHRETEPQIIERLKEFGFAPREDGDDHDMYIKEKSTGNIYLLTCSAYEITVMFEHIKTGEGIKICEISNFALSAHTIMNIIIASIDSWLQYGVVYDYRTAQHFTEGSETAAAAR